MSTRGTVYQTVQIGPEVTKGTLVPATKKLFMLGLDPVPVIPVKKVRYPGSKAYVATLLGQEHTEAKFTGTWDFNLLAYLFNSIFGNPTTTTPASGILARQRVWTPSPINPIDPNTYTFEQGSSRGAEKFGYGFFNDVTMKWTKEDNSLEGNIIGAQLLRNQTMTALTSGDVLPVLACMPKAIGVWISIDGGDTFTRLSKTLEGDFKFGALYKPVNHVSDLNPSFDSTVEIGPDFQVTLTYEEGAEADDCMTALEDGQMIYLGLQVQGPLIETVTGPISYYNLLKVRMPVFVTKPAPGDKQGVWGNTFTMEIAHDEAFGMAQITLINALATLA